MKSERSLLAEVIGEYIKSTRKDLGMHQSELAQRSGMHECTLRRIENGYESLSVYSLRKLLGAMGEDGAEFWQRMERNMKIREE